MTPKAFWVAYVSLAAEVKATESSAAENGSQATANLANLKCNTYPFPLGVPSWYWPGKLFNFRFNQQSEFTDFILKYNNILLFCNLHYNSISDSSYDKTQI